MLQALFVLYAVTTVGLVPAEIGLGLAAGRPGSLLGAVAVGRLGDRLGVGRLIAACKVLTGISRLIIPVAALVSGGWAAVAVLAGSTFLLGFARTVFNITQVSLRVAITDERMHGRVYGTVRFVMWSVTPFGAVIGGLPAGSALGLEGTLILAGFGVLAATLPLLAPGIRTVRTIPAGVA